MSGQKADPVTEIKLLERVINLCRHGRKDKNEKLSRWCAVYGMELCGKNLLTGVFSLVGELTHLLVAAQDRVSLCKLKAVSIGLSAFGFFPKYFSFES